MSIENDIRLLGNLGGDPETKYTQGGMAITKFSLATTSRRKDKDGNKVEETQWHRCVAFGKLGEICGEYLRKGHKIAAQGSIRYGSYEKEGVKHYTTDIVLDQMQMLGGRDESGSRGNAPSRQDRKQSKPAQQDDGFSDDDLPF